MNEQRALEEAQRAYYAAVDAVQNALLAWERDPSDAASKALIAAQDAQSDALRAVSKAHLDALRARYALSTL